VVASVPYRITFASRSKKKYDVTEAYIANNSCFSIFMLRLIVTFVLRYATHT